MAERISRGSARWMMMLAENAELRQSILKLLTDQERRDLALLMAVGMKTSPLQGLEDMATGGSGDDEV